MGATTERLVFRQISQVARDTRGKKFWWAACRECTSFFKGSGEIRIPRHTRLVRGIGWGGKAMHLPCPGGARSHG